jgi:hypothetical protein
MDARDHRGELVPAHPGHPVVGDDEAETAGLAPENRQRRLRIGRLCGLVAAPLQEPYDDTAHGALVVHDEDGRRRACGAEVRIDVGQVRAQDGSPLEEPYGMGCSKYVAFWTVG